MPRLAVALALAAVVCGGCGATGDNETKPLATRSSSPIAFLRAEAAEGDPATGIEPSHELVIVDSDGGNVRIVRTPGHDVESFSWSPDGRRLVLAARPIEDYRRTLFVANVDGTGLRKLRQTPDHSPDPVWSPRGDMIAWDNHDDGLHAIWVIKADGTDARKLTPGIRFTGPMWSPDGTMIAYRDQADPAGGLYMMNADGSAKTRFTHLETGDWTKMGITYRARGGIGFVEADGSAGPVVIEVGDEWKSYRFSPDGRTLAMWGPVVPGGDWELGVASIGGGGVRRLTDNDREDLGASWSPDGKSVVFEAHAIPPVSDEDPVPPGDIYVMNADGSDERNLTKSPVHETAPAWAPER